MKTDQEQATECLFSVRYILLCSICLTMPAPQGCQELEKKNHREKWIKRHPDGYASVIEIERLRGGEWEASAKGYPDGYDEYKPAPEYETIAVGPPSHVRERAREWVEGGGETISGAELFGV